MDQATHLNQLAQDLFSHLEIEIKSTAKEEQGGIINLVLQSEHSGILIGYHGETLLAIQHFLSLQYFRLTSSWPRLSVDISDYRVRRQEALERLAKDTVEKVLATAQAYTLPPMPAAERRLIHLALADHPEVETVSQGEGPDRRVVIQLKAR